MVFDAAGRLYVLTDHPKNNVLVFELDGSLADAWTLGMSGAHGLTIACEGERGVLFITDAYGGRVVKTTLAGDVLLTLPSPHELGEYRDHEPYLPTQTAVAPNGDVYVADGYGSQRVLRFDASGRLLQSFGGKGRGPGTLDFAHGIAVDTRRGKGNETLLVTSRVRQCFERFDLEGRHLETIALPGGYPCRPVIQGENVYVALCWSGYHLKPNSGFVVVLDAENRIVATLGGHLESGKLASDFSVFHHAHDVAVAPNGDVFVCEWNAGNVYPVALRRIA